MSTELHDLAAAYPLDAVDDIERAAFERHLTSCADCRRTVVELLEATSSLAAAVEADPPAGLRAAVLDAVGDISQVSDGVETAPASAERRARLRRVVTWASAAVLVLAVVGLSLFAARLGDRLDRAEAVREVLAQPDAQVVQLEGTAATVARLVLSPSEGRAVFLADDLDPIGDDETYELWLISEAGPVPAGLFHPDDGAVTLLVEGDAVPAASAVGVTVEPSGGSSQPTGEILLIATF